MDKEEVKNLVNNLVILFTEELFLSEESCVELTTCKTLDDIVTFFKNSNELKEAIECSDTIDEIESIRRELDSVTDEKDELEETIEELEDTIKSIEEELDEANSKIFKPVTYWDKEKYELFLKYHHKFTPLEFESILN